MEVFIFCIIVIVVYRSIFYFGMRHGEYISRKENFNEIDFRNEEYYRDILKEFSATEISYIDDLKLEIKKDIVATLLNLKLKNKIQINENEIIVLDKNTINLKKTEKFILENIKDGRVNIYDGSNFEVYFIEEAKEDNLISQKKKEDTNKSNIYYDKKFMLGFLFIIIAFIYGFILDFMIDFFGGEKILSVIGALLMVGSFLNVFAIALSQLSYSLRSPMVDVRTQRGEELNKKIKGLKKYVLDYSNLYEKDIKDLIIWNEYLIYSVIFDINTQIVDELSELIKFTYEPGKFYIKRKQEIEKNQIIYIDNEKYIAEEFIEYTKGNTLVKKYKIIDTNNSVKWFVIEINDDIGRNYYLYDEYQNKINKSENKIVIENKEYILYRNGDTCIREFFDTTINPRAYCTYCDYICEDNYSDNILSLEYWTDITYQHIGTKITADRINITNEFKNDQEEVNEIVLSLR